MRCAAAVGGRGRVEFSLRWWPDGRVSGRCGPVTANDNGDELRRADWRRGLATALPPSATGLRRCQRSVSACRMPVATTAWAGAWCAAGPGAKPARSNPPWRLGGARDPTTTHPPEHDVGFQLTARFQVLIGVRIECRSACQVIEFVRVGGVKVLRRITGGDAETGFGADIGAGIAWKGSKCGFSAELRGRGLLIHDSKGFRERGLSRSLGWDPRRRHEAWRSAIPTGWGHPIVPSGYAKRRSGLSAG